ncbi:HNH endonuclease [Paramicrobacterium chengjingii]|uniref:DUF222 domain-containing protein n=1 Tax=Paramicrobacterium chengjingii TaxID=2769067 RepID=A0ABX6YKW2_9MICO|nr:HNH endonuclease signature motif containing protein [Microbacterium chengjingii]QPZ39046.1 DUF222 domain-containing protein [Microbacterium chengjingii]
MQSTSAASGVETPEGPDAVAARIAENALSAVAELASINPAQLSANALLTYVGVLGNIARLVEGRQIGNVGDIARRSDTDAGFEGLAARHGSSSPTGLFEKITGVKNSTAHRYSKVAEQTTPRVSDTGLPLDPMFTQTADALAEGTIGLDVAEVITSALAPVLSRVAPEQADWAENTLLGNATGAYGEIPVTADALRQQARMFCVALDPDGVEPTAEELHQARALLFRHQDDGSMRITGTLSPEQAAQVTPVFDAFMSKRTSPKFMETEELAAHGEEPEARSKQQERADVFTPKQRLALIARDGGTCVAADCDIPAWLCEAHHVHGWAKDGKTDTTNGVMLCWWHHRLVERGEWSLTRDNTGQPRLVPPDWYVNRRYLGRRRKPGDDNDTGPDPGRDTRPRT